MAATKIATCCYCGTKAALVLKGRERHELSCGSCGAPLNKMKMLPAQATAPAATPARPAMTPKYRAKKQKKKSKPFGRKFKSLWDVIEDVVDEVFD